MKVYRKIIISICIVIAIILTAILCIDDPFLKTVISGNYPSQEEYSLWKDYSVEVAKNLDNGVITDKEVSASHHITNNEMTVEIYSYKYGITIESTYPVDYVKSQSGKLEMQVDYEDAEYTEYYKSMPFFGTNKILPFIVHILVFCLLGTIPTLVIYIILYGIPKDIYCFVQFIKSKKKHNS